jgi:hypothetical protein
VGNSLRRKRFFVGELVGIYGVYGVHFYDLDGWVDGDFRYTGFKVIWQGGKE